MLVVKSRLLGPRVMSRMIRWRVCRLVWLKWSVMLLISILLLPGPSDLVRACSRAAPFELPVLSSVNC